MPTSALIAAASLFNACAAVEEAPAPARDLVGVWEVALYFSESDPPSATVLEILAIEDGELTGSFYGSPFEQARLSVRFEEIAIAAVTSDASGAYHHAARLQDGVLIGQTLSTGRGFLMQWRAERAPQDC